MKRIRAFLLILLSLALIFLLFSCGECKHEDENNDGICDKCDEKLEITASDIALIKDGIAQFQIVRGNDSFTEKTSVAIKKLYKSLTSYGIDINEVADKADNIQDIEVLIGTVTSRGSKYEFDRYSLGIKGYVIKIVDSKIIICGGSDESLASAIEEF